MRWLLLVILAASAGCTSPTPPADPPAGEADAALLAELEALASFPELRFTTPHGTIRMVLYEAWTPQTAAHIGSLAEAGFYDGTLVHRVIDDFVIQGGDPTGTGEGGSGPAGTPDPVPLEIREGLDFGSGAVGLARWTDDTGDSQWFITEKPALHLSRPSGTTGQVFGAYALFAQVFDGMDVVRRIAAVETIPHLDRPVQDVVLEKAQLLPPPPDADLVNLIPAVHPDVPAGNEAGTLELPRWAIVGHPASVRFTAPGDGPCAVPTGPHVEGNATYTPWRAAEDPCTFETRVTFLEAGQRSLAASGDGQGAVGFDVLPWHDDYAAYVGAAH